MLTFRRVLSLPLLLLVSTVHVKESPFSRIAQAHLASFPVVEEAVPSTKPKTLNEQLKPWAHQKFSDRDICSILYQSLTHSKLAPTPVFNTNGSKDLEIVCGSGKEAQANVLNTLQPVTTMGTIYAAYLLDNPTADTRILQSRQAIIRTLTKDTILMQRALTYLANVKERETNMASILKDAEATQALHQVLFYTNNWPVLKHLKSLNKSVIFQDLVSAKNYALTSLLGVGMPALYGTVFARFAPDVPTKIFCVYIGLGSIYGAYIFKTVLIDAELQAQKTVIGFARFLHCVDLIAQNSDIHPELKHMDTAHLVEKYTSDSSSQLSNSMKKLVNLLRKNTFKGDESYFSHHGNSKVAYALLLECKDELHELFEIVGELDTYVACAKLMQQSADQKVGYSFAAYVENASAPYISATNIWHPLIGAQKSVTNSIEFGGTDAANVILTGPNAGGKSTFLKGLTLNVLFAQSLGIVPQKRFVLTPFAKINTYMNIADDTAGGNSLFKSEVLRAQALLNTVKTLPEGQFAFSVMDEMFCGTSPKEGEAASYAVAEKLGSLKSSMLLLATHFQKLTELQDKTGYFKNYQVRVERHDNGTFSYPFKLQEGKADQNVAIEILQQQGFDTSILDSAHAILQN